jgi:hypothetical protein
MVKLNRRDMEQEIVEFLLSKGVLKEGNSVFEIKFSDGKTVSVNNLMRDFTELYVTKYRNRIAGMTRDNY